MNSKHCPAVVSVDPHVICWLTPRPAEQGWGAGGSPVKPTLERTEGGKWGSGRPRQVSLQGLLWLKPREQRRCVVCPLRKERREHSSTAGEILQCLSFFWRRLFSCLLASLLFNYIQFIFLWEKNHEQPCRPIFGLGVNVRENQPEECPKTVL